MPTEEAIMSTVSEPIGDVIAPIQRSAALDQAHVGDINGALGTIHRGDHGPRQSLYHRLTTLLAILGPGLIVMAGDNDAGAFSTYSQAGQNYGTTLLWTLMLLIPVLYVNQEMVIRLGAVTGVGHARLILERFGRFWGAFSVIDLFLLNALTIISEFIGINLGLQYLGLPKVGGVLIAVGIVIAAASTGNFRRFERFALCLVLFSLLLVPLFVMVHPPAGELANGLLVPQMPVMAEGGLADVMLLIIAIVGTTVAPWQLFFQQSYIIDKRIPPRFIKYARTDLALGIVIVIGGAIALMAAAASTFAAHPEFGNFTDTGGVAAGIEKYIGRVPAIVFALALINYSIIGASAISLSTAYAMADVLKFKHSLHRKVTEAKTFYAIYAGLLAGAAALVLTPNIPLGLLTNAVQALAGVLLPSATVFLLLLCNDKAVLGPWVNGRRINLFTGAVIAILVMLSIILTASVLFPGITGNQILAIVIGGSVLAILTAVGARLATPVRVPTRATAESVPPTLQVRLERDHWRMPPLDELPPTRLTMLNRIWLLVLRAYLVVAGGLVLARVVMLAIGQA
jgi:NRAMP (natural resistance-associated macrophage protein)-like metal ion transporter